MSHLRFLILFLLMTLAMTPQLRAAENDVKDQLQSQAAPWYDRETDTWRQVIPPKKAAPAAPSGSSGGGGGGGGGSWGSGIGDIGAAPFAYIMLFLVVLVALAVLVNLVMTLRANLPSIADDEGPQRPRNNQATIEALPFALPGEDGNDPAAALQAALKNQDWRRAVIWLFAWQLLRGDDAGWIRLAAGKTNRGYLREMGRGSAPSTATAALRATINVFEPAFFGHQAVSKAEVDELMELERDFASATKQHSSGAYTRKQAS